MDTESNVLPTTELVGSIMTNNMDSDAITQLKEDPQAYILSHANVNVSNKIAIVENSANSVALALPYYESLDAITSDIVKDADLDNVAGGEILITLFVLIGATVGTAVAATTIVSATTGVSVGIAVGAVVGVSSVAGIAVGATHASGKLMPKDK